MDIRAIKITLGLDILRCKTPEMVRKEMWACVLAYNLIRRIMLQSARASGMLLRQFSSFFFLHEHLDGYREYAQQVRYRLIPGIW